MAADSSSIAGGDWWQPFELRFDVHPKFLRPRPGEEVIDRINSVEDTKGNNGMRGSLCMTNLRIMWTSHRSDRVNLSIGYSTIQTITIRTTDSRLRGGRTQALFLMTRMGKKRYEFIFTSLVKASPRMFTTVQAVFRAYETSKLFRDLRLRGAIIKDGALIHLPDEEVYLQQGGVMNLSAEQGNLGTLFITNIRMVWHADLAENFNVSIPYLQMTGIGLRESRFGKALVLTTTPRSGNYTLGFKVEPEEKLTEVFRAVQAMHTTFAARPVFGVKYTIENQPAPLAARTVSRVTEDVEIIEGEETTDSFAAYLAAASAEPDRPLVFDEGLGLAMEQLPAGMTVAKLWKV